MEYIDIHIVFKDTSRIKRFWSNDNQQVESTVFRRRSEIFKLPIIR